MPTIKEKYDVIIIGSGAAACATAIKCAQLGLAVLCIDNLAKEVGKKLMPGVFANDSRLETITLLESAKIFGDLIHTFTEHGIYVENINLNLEQMMQRKNSIIAHINQYNYRKFAELGIDFINANAMLLAIDTVEITSISRKMPLKVFASHIILATEAIPIPIACAPIDNQFIFDSAAALNLTEIPNRLAIIGAGVNGLELAGIWNRLGSETILLDAQESFLSLVDNQISREAYKVFTEQGLELRLGARVLSTKIINNKVHVEYQDNDGNHAIRVDKLIVASGRKPNSSSLSSPEANLLLDDNNYVHVNEFCRTNLPNVYAIGDLTMLGPMLPQKGIAEGIFVSEQIAGFRGNAVNYHTIPNVIYTEPEIAWVGQTEQALKAKGDAIKVGITPLNIFTQTKSVNKIHGLVKVIACAKTDVIKGIHIFASKASELISEAALAMEFSSTTEDIARTIHSHPSFSETIREACEKIKNNQ